MERIKRMKKRKRRKINKKEEKSKGNPSQQEEPNGFNMETRQIEMGRQEGRTAPEAKPPGKGADEGRGNMEETVTLCYSHSKESKQGNRTEREPKERARRPTTHERGRETILKSHCYPRKRKGKQEGGKVPGAAKNSIGTPRAPNGRKKEYIKKSEERIGKSHQGGRTSKEENRYKKRKQTERHDRERIPRKYKKRKTAHRPGEEEEAGAKRKREQAKTKTHKNEAKSQVSVKAADASHRGGMQTRGGRRKPNTTGRWRTGENKEEMEKKEEREASGKEASIKRRKKYRQPESARGTQRIQYGNTPNKDGATGGKNNTRVQPPG